MQAASGPAPNGLDWGYEFHWSGRRCLAMVEGDVVELVDRSRSWITHAYPRSLLRALGQDRTLVLDGVMADADERRPIFAPRPSRTSRRPIHVGRREGPSFVAFDVLSLDGTSLLAKPYWVRRSVLAGLGLHREPYVVVPPHFRDISSVQVLAIAHNYQLDGIVAKRMESHYWPGRHSRDWIRTRCGSSPPFDLRSSVLGTT